ncbi:hypothetical protein [Devosia rhizoryzae]|uniref:Uncharacterized protein n=1 Tax=Devosia rhizoryzae TaxID=2774137 RepID=A0ABX7C3B3_9HYPH|nr:hypothetical protein [Devosia rhizoryzae]QQR38719.1 hypothetical protein JI748_13260 [Devosia rhizoryzae]
MPCCQKDLSLPTYGLIAFFFVGHEVLGFKTTLVLGFGFLAAMLVLSIAAVLLQSWRRRRIVRTTPQTGGDRPVTFR